jgi:chromosome segregation ATPase
MADFESAANAAVSTLEAISTLANTSTTEFTQASSKLSGMADDYLQQNSEIDAGWKALESQISKAESQKATRISEIKQELSQIKKRASAMQDKLKKELAERESQAGKLDEKTENLRELAKKLTESVVNDADESKAKLDEANDAMYADLDKLETEIEAGQNQLKEFVEELSQQDSSSILSISFALSDITSQADDVSAHLSQLNTNFSYGITEKTAALITGFGILGQEPAKTQAQGWDDVDVAIGELKEMLTEDKVGGAIVTAITDMTTMNGEMERNEESYGEVSKRLSELVDVFRNMTE